jgi:undecaprenyl-diphosphatase
MDVFQAIILGIIQGITEWLPISSSGHLAITQHFFGLELPIAFDVLLHLGSLIVVIIFFWKEIKNLIIGTINLKKESLTLLSFIILATLPIAFFGYFFGDVIGDAFQSLLMIGIGLLFTSLMLFLSRYNFSGIIKKTNKHQKLRWYNALIIGIFQAVALFPGISRSGSTISSGLLQGIKREDVARFSFIIFIPAMLGALILEYRNITLIENTLALIIGTIVSAIVGYFTLKLLMFIIKKNKFSWFSLYCLILGLIIIGISIF